MIRAALALMLLATPVVSQERPVISEIVAPQAGLASSWVGNVSAASEIDLGFLQVGTLAERVADAGDVVQAGEILARLDGSELEAQVRAAEAGVSIAKANLQTAQDTSDRVQALVDRGVDSPSAAEAATNSLASAKAALEQAQAGLARAEDARAQADLRAPIDGIVTDVLAEPGAALDAGQTVLRLAAREGREAIISLSEEDAAAAEPGARYHVRLLANPEMMAEAVLDRIEPVSARATRTRAAHLRLEGDLTSFRLGALVTVTRSDLGIHSVITLPVVALIDGTEPPAVWIISGAERKLHRTTLKLGPRAGGRVVVLSGVQPGDEVLTHGVHSVSEGQAVGPRLEGPLAGGGNL